MSERNVEIGDNKEPVSNETEKRRVDCKSSIELTHNAYTVGWVCALPKEQTAATAMLDQRHADLPKPPNDPNTYTLGSVGKHNVVIACLPKGKVGTSPAATVAAWIISTFPSIKFGLMVGIGGGIPPKVKLGDVVVSTPVDQFPGVVQWDFGKAKQGGNFERVGSLNNPPNALLTALAKLETEHELNGSQIPKYLDELKQRWPRLAPKYMRSDSLNDMLFKADYGHVSKSKTDCATILDNNNGEEEGENCRFCDRTQVIKRRPRDMRVHYGLIMSGNQVIKDATVRDKLNKDLGGNVLCVEMEAAGLINNFPCIVIRGICDYADSHKNKDWQEHAAAVAAAFAKELLGYVQPSDVDGERTAKDILSQVLYAVPITRENVVRMKSKLDRGEDIKILNWLTPIDYGPQQTDYIRRRQPGTGQWLLDSTEYQEWLSTDKQTLFCPGIPGAGKTIITAIVIDYVNTWFRNDPRIGIAFIYCNFRRQQEQKFQDLLANLLKQLSQGQASIPDSVEALYNHHRNKRTRPSCDEISEALHSVATMYSRVFIIVDALDECQKSNGCMTKFLSEIFSLQGRCGANIFTTSRFIPEITERFAGTTSLEIRAYEEDVRRYLDSHIFQLPAIVGRNPTLQEEIKATILKVAGGMFLLAQLHLDSLSDKLSSRELRDALRKLATGSAAYDCTYNETMERIREQKSGFRVLAEKVLMWITCAKRPLTIIELQHALALQVGDSALDIENIPEIEDMVSVCAGLVTIDEESGIIRLVHYTTQEYFERTQKDWFPNAAIDITRICVTYLSFSVFKSGFCQTIDEFEQRLDLYRFYDYAARNWGHHAREALATCEEVIDFLENDVLVSASSQALMASEYASIGSHSQTVPRQIQGVHIAAYFGLQSATAILLGMGHNPAAKDDRNRTPLSWAAEKGREAVLNCLLTQTSVEPDDKDNGGRTPLSWAAENGHERSVGFLLEKKADPTSRDTRGRTPLHWAARNGHKKIVESLIKGGAHIDSTDERGSTALHESIRRDHQAVQELLIESGANLDIKDLDDQTASDLAWSKKPLDSSAFVVDLDLTATINQGRQAVCEVLRKDGQDISQVIFRKKFDMSQTTGKSVRKYLLRENKILQKLSHPFIVCYLGYEEDTTQKTASLYMEFCEGGDLQRQHIRRKLYFDDDSDDSDLEHAEPFNSTGACDPLPLPEEEVWSIAFQLAAAMAYLHHGLSIKRNDTFSFEKHWESVIHRDIKPANVVLKTLGDGRRVAKLCDLGLVKAVMECEKQTRGIGTLDYSPPEVISRKGWTIQGDIYSFGVTIDDLYREAGPRSQLTELLENCKAADPSARPSSLSILEIARNHVAGHKNIIASLHNLLGLGSGSYLLSSLVTIASVLDEHTAFGDETRLRRQRILKRLKLLCEDGAEELFFKHSKSLHLSVLLNHQDKLKQLLGNGQNAGANEKWQNSGWTPLHLAIQEDRQDMVALLVEHGANSGITDKYMRRPDYYKERRP